LGAATSWSCARYAGQRLRQIGNVDDVARGAEQLLGIVGDKRAVDGDLEILPALAKKSRTGSSRPRAIDIGCSYGDANPLAPPTPDAGDNLP
jgi:hypothetical protein